MYAPVFGETTTFNKLAFWGLIFIFGVYSLIAVVFSFYFTAAKHWQVIFYGIALIIIDVVIMTIAVPWKRQTVEDIVKWGALVLIAPLFILGLVIFTSGHYKGDFCAKNCGNSFCLNAKGDEPKCLSCATHQYVVFNEIANGATNPICRDIPTSLNKTRLSLRR